MKAKVLQVAILALLLVIANTLITYGQLEKEDEKDSLDQTTGTLEPAGLNDPPPAGFTVLYLFTGVANEAASGLDEATVVHCTNIGSEATNVQVQVFGPTGGEPYAGTVNILPGYTRTFSTQSTAAFADNVILLPAALNIFQGSGRVLVEQHNQVICTAQLLDADADPPTYVVELHMYRP